MGYKLFLDDLRSPHHCCAMIPNFRGLYKENDWVIVRSYDEFVSHIKLRWESHKEAPTLISFDHDLGFEHTRFYFENGGHENPPEPDYDSFIEKTGKDCANWLTFYCETEPGMNFPDYIVHSKNPVGAKNIKSILDQYASHIS